MVILRPEADLNDHFEARSWQLLVRLVLEAKKSGPDGCEAAFMATTASTVALCIFRIVWQKPAANVVNVRLLELRFRKTRCKGLNIS